MTSLDLVVRNALRARTRTAILMLSILIAFTLFGVLAAFERAFSAGAEGGRERLITVNRISFTQPLPLAHYQRALTVPGIGAASYASWFGGYYREPRQSLHAMAVEPRSYLEVYGADLRLGEAERAAFLGDRTGILVGEAMAARWGWRVGDRVPIVTRAAARRDGARAWTFTVAGIFRGGTAQIDTNFLYLHHAHLNEARLEGRDTIGWIVTAPAPGVPGEELGRRIDRLFETEADRTTTDTERSFNRAFVAQFGDLARIVVIVLGAAFVSLLLIVGNTTMLAVRERTREIGVLKALGFPGARIAVLVMAETLLVTFVAGSLGLLLAAVIVHLGRESLSQIAPGMAVGAPIVALGLALMAVLTLVSGMLPAVGAMRLSPTAALRRI